MTKPRRRRGPTWRTSSRRTPGRSSAFHDRRNPGTTMQTESGAIGQPMFDAGNAAYRPNGGVKDIGEYLDTFRRRKLPMLWTMTTLFLLVAAVVLLWPSSYRSTATILIEEQEIPPDLVRSTVSSYADQRIQVISQQVMTRANLMQIIDKYKLYDSYRANHT